MLTPRVSERCFSTSEHQQFIFFRFSIVLAGSLRSSQPFVPLTHKNPRNTRSGGHPCCEATGDGSAKEEGPRKGCKNKKNTSARSTSGNHSYSPCMSQNAFALAAHFRRIRTPSSVGSRALVPSCSPEDDAPSKKRSRSVPCNKMFRATSSRASHGPSHGRLVYSRKKVHEHFNKIISKSSSCN